MVRAWRLVIALALLVAARPAWGQTPAADDGQRIQGTWQLIYSESDGKPAPIELLKSIHVNISDGRHEVFRNDEKLHADITYTLDPTTSPKSTTDTLHGGEDEGKQINGIYELDGDTLISCVGEIGKPRPSTFETAPGSGRTLRVLARVKAGEGPEQKAIREEYMKFGGTWTYETLVVDGRPVASTGEKGPRLIIQGNRFHLITPQGPMSGSYTVNPLASPKTIDTTIEGPEKGQELKTQGIYELDPETYRVCAGLTPGQRPSKLEAPAGSGNALQVLKRRKP